MSYDPEQHGALCQLCILRTLRVGGPVPAEWHEGAQAIIVAEAPGETEVAQGRPLCGHSGQETMSALGVHGLQRGHFHWTNAVMCLRGDAMVRLADGSARRIMELVKEQYAGEVLSVGAGDQIVTRRVTGWHRSPQGARRMVRVTLDTVKGNPKRAPSVVVTEEHTFLTARGWVAAGALREDDHVAVGEPALYDRAASFFDGTMLGDATIARRNLQFSHVFENADYVELKARMFAALGGGVSVVHAGRRTGMREQHRYSSRALQWIGAQRARWYPCGKKRVPTDIRINVESVAAWFLDDGYMRLRVDRAPAAEFATNGFVEEDARFLAAQLKRVFALDPIVRYDAGWRIALSTRDTPRFAARIAHLVPASMQYKLPPEFRGEFDAAAWAPEPTETFWARPRVEVAENLPGAKLVYCIDVEDTHNFVTLGGVVHNCRPAENNMELALHKLQQENARRKKENARLPADQQLPPLPTPQQACRPRLIRELEAAAFASQRADGAPDRLLNVLAMGKHAWNSITQANDAIGAVRGGPAEFWLDKNGAAWPSAWPAVDNRDPTRLPLHLRVMPTQHPAFVLHSPKWRTAFRGDFGRAFRWWRGALAWKPTQILTNPSPAQLREFLSWPWPGKKFNVDFETDGKEPLTCQIRMLGITTEEGDYGVRVHFLGVDGQTRYYTDADQDEIEQICKAFLADKRIAKVGHNFNYFDRMVARARWGVTPENVEDSIIVMRLADSEMPKTLAYGASIWTDAPSWKKDKKALTAQNDDDLGVYCLGYGQSVVMADGSTRSIDELVRTKSRARVLSLNQATGRFEAKPIVGWHRNDVDDQRWVEIRTPTTRAERRGLIVTPDHPVLIDGEWLPAGDARVGQRLHVNEVGFTREEEAAVRGTLLGDSTLGVSPTYRANWQEAPTAYLQGVHSLRQGLSAYKARALPEHLELGVIIPAGEVAISGRRGDAGPARAYRTRNLRQLRAMMPDHYYVDGARRLNADLLDELGPIGLAWWFMDDGARQKLGAGERIRDSVIFSTYRYSRADVNAAVAWFRARYGATIAGADRVIRLGTRAAEKLAEEIAEHLPAKVRHKLPRQITPAPFKPLASTTARAVVTDRIVEIRDAKPKSAAPAHAARYCIDVADNHNFFTPTGLVHNCINDCAADGRMMPAARAAMQHNGQAHLYDFFSKNQLICAGMHEMGMFVDEGARREWDRKLLAEAKVWLRRVQLISGRNDLNPNSTAQLRDLLFKDWNLAAEDFTKLGDPSTGDEVLRKLLKEHSGLTREQKWGVKSVRKFRRASKLRGTYVVPLRPNSELAGWDLFAFNEDERLAEVETLDGKAIDDDERIDRERERSRTKEKKPGLTMPDGRVHPDFNAHGTTSGRFSSSNPNGQNFWKKLRAIIRAAPGRVLVGCDQSQLELRMAAALWGCQQYIEAFQKGEDPHRVTCWMVYGKAYFESLGPVQREMLRAFAKRFSYAVLYGASLETVHDTLTSSENPNTGHLLFPDLSIRETRKSMKSWLGANPEIVRGWEGEVSFFRQHGFLEEPIVGHRRFFRDGEDRNELLNFRCQSGGAMVVHRATQRLVEEFIPFGKWGPGTGLIQQGHDSLVVEVPENQVEYAKMALETCMSQAVPAFPFMPFKGEAKAAYTWDKV